MFYFAASVGLDLSVVCSYEDNLFLSVSRSTYYAWLQLTNVDTRDARETVLNAHFLVKDFGKKNLKTLSKI